MLKVLFFLGNNYPDILQKKQNPHRMTGVLWESSDCAEAQGGENATI